MCGHLSHPLGIGCKLASSQTFTERYPGRARRHFQKQGWSQDFQPAKSGRKRCLHHGCQLCLIPLLTANPESDVTDVYGLWKRGCFRYASPESMAPALPAARQLSMPLGSLLPQQAHLESLPEGISAGSLQAAPGISCWMGQDGDTSLSWPLWRPPFWGGALSQ